jgi:hypothetical protein
VTTEDGYILTMHRIPYSPASNSSERARPIVFLQHGLISSSVDWVIMGPGKALGKLKFMIGFRYLQAPSASRQKHKLQSLHPFLNNNRFKSISFE